MGLTAVDSMAGHRIKAFDCYAQAFRKKPRGREGLALIPRRRAMLADRLHDLPVPAILPLHVNHHKRMR